MGDGILWGEAASQGTANARVGKHKAKMMRREREKREREKRCLTWQKRFPRLCQDHVLENILHMEITKVGRGSEN